jgi:primosomal protein N' (replication factor Y) (superfamily II helicase)
MVNGAQRNGPKQPQPPFCGGKRLAVLLPLPIAGPYDYSVPADFVPAVGDFVEVPLGQRILVGVVWGVGSDSVTETKLKAIRRLLPAPPLPDVSRRFVDWVASYTVFPPGAVLRMAMSVPEALLPAALPQAMDLASPPPHLKLTPARRRILALLSDGLARPIAELAREAACSAAVVRGLVAAGALRAVEVPAAPEPLPDWRRRGLDLTPSQAESAATLRAAVSGGYAVRLLDGVPGSGKTEVYFEAIAEALARDLQVLVLLPEIALSAQWRARFIRRFGAPPREWHSDLARGERRRTWRSVAEGEINVVVGARSALFLPFRQLGLIVVDEEHDPSFKQEEGVTYHARDMAVVRARLGEIPCVLVSATPSLETVINARTGRYAELVLRDRHGGVPIPAIEVVDLRHDRPPKGAFVAPSLRRALVETLAAGKQAMLFLNRRGYAPLTLCRACGHRIRCPSCTAWLVEHRLVGRLQCHHCGFASPLPKACPACGAQDSLSACGPGVERLAEEVADIVPRARTLVATSDTLTGPAAAADLVRRIETHDVDLIIGTQIVAKGYHFPELTLVGCVDADLGLSGGDLRAAERTFQLLYQVAGRSGRGDVGRVLMQTCWPEHPVIVALAAGDRERFLATEEHERREAAMPPFGRLAALIISGRDEASVDAAARALARNAPPATGLRVLGPAPAPLALLRGRHRRRILLHAPRAFSLSGYVRDWVASVAVPSTIRVHVDIDPQSFL